MRVMLTVLIPLLLLSSCGAGFLGNVRLDDDRPIIELRTEKCFAQAEKVEGGWNLRVRGDACIVYNYTTGEVEGDKFPPDYADGQTLFVSDQNAELIFERWQIRNRLTDRGE